MITATGENLDIVIAAKTGDHWRAFATWYSVFKNLPDARVFLALNRTTRVEVQNFEWAKRLNLPHVYLNPPYHDDLSNRLHMIDVAQKRGFRERVLLITSAVMAVDVLDDHTISLFENHPILSNENALYVNMATQGVLGDMGFANDESLKIDTTPFCFEVKDDNDFRSLVSYDKGCGKWIDRVKGCPFSNASSLVVDQMTVNEMRIIELWQKMVPLGNAVL